MPEQGARAPILILQHIDCEPPAAFEDELVERKVAVRRIRADLGEPLIDWRGHSAIVAMGGPMGTYEEDRHPWLVDERRLIADAVGQGLPFWGVCLGAQLLAAALGADVAPGPTPEIGMHTVALTAAAATDPVFAGAPQSFPSFHWHGDTYTLPPGGVQLARSDLYEQQAFVVRRAYGLQFHLEVSAPLVAEWAGVPAYAESLLAVPAEQRPPALIEQLSAAEPVTIPLARDLFARWLENVVGL